jgi:hypothetical protein
MKISAKIGIRLGKSLRKGFNMLDFKEDSCLFKTLEKEVLVLGQARKSLC